mmetsp:Transcript_39364/g.82309  ORF Transcript_39364/g.82309 Transcript_39364/m.82309 type:complete len:273 (-) Transcript_39364:12-830(-)
MVKTSTRAMTGEIWPYGFGKFITRLPFFVKKRWVKVPPTKKLRMASKSSLWPSKEECPNCWQSLTDDTGLVMNMDSYDKEALYNHLKKTYWPSGVHNNRLIVLARWSKAKRALSMKRLQARMAAHEWPISVLVVHVLLAYLVIRIAFPRGTIPIMKDMFRQVLYGAQAPVRKRKKKEKVAYARYDENGSPYLPRNSEDPDRNYVYYGWDERSGTPQYRQSEQAMAPYRNDYSSEASQYSYYRSNEGRRRYTGSGYQKTNKPSMHSFDHFLEL